MANKPSALGSWGQFPLRLETLTQAALAGLTANPNLAQDPKEIAQKAIQIALETCNQLDTIIKALTPEEAPVQKTVVTRGGIQKKSPYA